MVSRTTFAMAALAALLGCVPKKQAPPLLNNWSELCGKTDCEQFPIGYRTEQVGGEYFYFPIPPGDRTTTTVRGLYVERDEQGVITREARLDPRNRYLYLDCCRDLESRFGSLPRRAGYSEPSLIEFYASQKPTSPIPFGRRVSIPLTSHDDLRALDLPSFDENFWLVQEFPDSVSLHPDRTRPGRLLISKRPMLFGRHVWVGCTLFCDIETVTFPADPHVGFPSAKITNVSDPGYQPFFCGDPTRTRECTTGVEAFAVLPETLRWVELVFERLREKPPSWMHTDTP